VSNEYRKILKIIILVRCISRLSTASIAIFITGVRVTTKKSTKTSSTASQTKLSLSSNMSPSVKMNLPNTSPNTGVGAPHTAWKWKGTTTKSGKTSSPSQSTAPLKSKSTACSSFPNCSRTSGPIPKRWALCSIKSKKRSITEATSKNSLWTTD
jgi:hypothetical protein